MKVVATATAAGRSKFSSTSLTRAVREGSGGREGIRGMGAAAARWRLLKLNLAVEFGGPEQFRVTLLEENDKRHSHN